MPLDHDFLDRWEKSPISEKSVPSGVKLILIVGDRTEKKEYALKRKRKGPCAPRRSSPGIIVLELICRHGELDMERQKLET